MLVDLDDEGKDDARGENWPSSTFPGPGGAPQTPKATGSDKDMQSDAGAHSIGGKSKTAFAAFDISRRPSKVAPVASKRTRDKNLQSSAMDMWRFHRSRRQFLASESGPGSNAPPHVSSRVPSVRTRPAAVNSDGKSLRDLMDRKRAAMESAARATVHFQKMSRTDNTTAVVALLGLAVAIVDAEYSFDTLHNHKNATGFRVVSSAITAVVIVLLYLRTVLALRLGRETGDFTVRATMCSSGLARQLALEVAVCAVHLPPGLPDAWQTVSFRTLGTRHVYDLIALVSVPMLLRAYLLARVYLNHAPYTSQRARRIGRMGFTEVNYGFASKATLRDHPAQTLMFFFLATTLMCGYWLRVAERPLAGSVDGGGDFNSLWNCWWLVIITMSSVGFGEIYSVTHGGRFALAVAAAVGVMLVGLTVVTLQGALQLTEGEENAFQVLRALQLHSRLERRAALVVTRLFRFSMARGKLARRRAQRALRAAVADFAVATARKRHYVRARADLHQGYLHSFKESTLGGIDGARRSVDAVAASVRGIESRLDRLDAAVARIATHVTATRPMETPRVARPGRRPSPRMLGPQASFSVTGSTAGSPSEPSSSPRIGQRMPLVHEQSFDTHVFTEEGSTASASVDFPQQVNDSASERHPSGPTGAGAAAPSRLPASSFVHTDRPPPLRDDRDHR